jgi:GTPase KRas protein
MVYSITDKASFLRLQDHVKQISRVRDVFDLNSVPLVLLGNKCDLESHRQVSKEEATAFAESLGATFIEGSAKGHINITESFDALVRKVRILRGPPDPPSDKQKALKKKKKLCSIL